MKSSIKSKSCTMSSLERVVIVREVVIIGYNEAVCTWHTFTNKAWTEIQSRLQTKGQFKLLLIT